MAPANASKGSFWWLASASSDALLLCLFTKATAIRVPPTPLHLPTSQAACVCPDITTSRPQNPASCPKFPILQQTPSLAHQLVRRLTHQLAPILVPGHPAQQVESTPCQMQASVRQAPQPPQVLQAPQAPRVLQAPQVLQAPRVLQTPQAPQAQLASQILELALQFSTAPQRHITKMGPADLRPKSPYFKQRAFSTRTPFTSASPPAIFQTRFLPTQTLILSPLNS